MPESRLQRTRAAYACPFCDGVGHIEDYEGNYECSVCGGSGVTLDPPKPKPLSPGHSFITSDIMTREAVKQIASFTELAAMISKDYKR